MVHDISHQLHSIKHPDKRDHDFRHAWLEGEMVEFVIESGWLQGKLKPPEKPKVDEAYKRYDSVCRRLVQWERRWKRAQTAIRKLRATKLYYERKRGMT